MGDTPRDLVDQLERGEIGFEIPFLAQHKGRAEEADRLAAPACLATFEADLRAG